MKLGRRITFHFLFQLILTFVATFLIVLLLLGVIIYLAMNDEMKTNPKQAIVTNLPTSALINNDEDIQIGGSWKESLKENKMWMQLINEEGEVVYSLNTPKEGLQESYTINELLLLEETAQLGPYQIDTYFEKWGKEPYYYLFGYVEEETTFLKELYKTYSNDKGLVSEQQLSTVTDQLQKQNAFIEVFQNGERKQIIGKEKHESNGQLDILGRIHAPGNYQTKAFSFNDKDKQVAWTLYVKNKDYQASQLYLFVDSEVQIILTATLIGLFIAILFSVWHGYRYGKPLMLFIRWLDTMEERHYHQILDGKEYTRIYKKNGQVKLRYRLYKEVFQSLINLTNKLSHAEKEREKLDQTREEWMSGISHDLRTPLSSIQGYGHMLESNQYEFSEDELQQIGQVIRNQSDYMVNLVNDFSLVFQLKNSTISIKKTNVDLNSFLEKIVRSYQHDIQWQKYQLAFHPADNKCETAIDPKWFTRVLDNMLSNALKHNPPKTVIEVSVERHSHATCIHIIDNGKGMEKEVVAHLFNRYYKGTPTHARSEGEGLGMSIASAIVDLHGGQLTVDSTLGKGTTITITLFD